jgi:hypothetical protein
MANDADDDAALTSMLKDAMISTEKEIFGDAFGKEDMTLDETGDRSLEAMGEGLEGQHEPEDDEGEGDDADKGDETQAAKVDDAEGAKAKAEAEAKAAAEAEAGARRDDKGLVPSARLREQTEAARAAQAERDAIKAQAELDKLASRKEVADLNAKYDALIALQKQQAPAAPKAVEPEKPEIPEILEDPRAFVNHVTKQVDERVAQVMRDVRNRFLDQSMNVAKARHGEVFDKAYAALRAHDPQNAQQRAFVNSILDQPDPGEAAVTWFKRQEAMREIGEDPTAYAARVKEDARKELLADQEFRRQILQGMRAEASGDDPTPRNIVRLPPSLGRAQGGNGGAPNDLSAFDGSEQAIFQTAWKT